VLAHHYPDVPNLGDMTEMDVGPLGDIDVLVGGTPCQAFSVAGLRQSLNDARGNLTLSYVRLIHELVEHHNLRNAVWENVPGVLSTKDNAFGCFLGAIVGSDDPLPPPGGKRWPNSGMVSGPKGRAAWTIKDAQYFGLAQRRRRVFVVSDFGNGADPAAVLFEREGVRGNPAPRREAWKDVAPTISARTKGGGGLGTDFDLDGGLIQTASTGDVSHCLNAGGMGRIDYETETMIATHAIQAGAPRENPTSGPDGVGVQADMAYTLEARAEVQAVSVTGEISHTLKAEGFDASEDGTGRGNPIIAQTVALRGREGGATAEIGGEVATALRASGGGGDKAHVLTFAQDHAAGIKQSEISGTLTKEGPSGSAGGNGAEVLMLTSAVRRLTPVECERLQGFPDNYTNIPWRGKPTSPDGPRYKALGNSMAVPVMRWIGERIDRFMPRAEAPARKQLRFAANGRMVFE